MNRQALLASFAILLACGPALGQSNAEKKALAVLGLRGDFVTIDKSKPEKPVIGVTFYNVKEFDEKKLEALKELKNLKTISTYEATIAAGFFKAAGDLPKLTLVIITHGQLAPEAWKELGKLGTLASLGVDNEAFDDAALAELKDCKKLSSLRIASAKDISDQGVKALKDLPTLNKLTLEGAAGAKVTVAALKELKSLKEVALPQTKKAAADLKELSTLPQLETLFISSALDNDAMRVLASFPKLQKLTLSGSSLSDAQLALLKDAANLRSLDVSCDKVTGTGLKDLKNLTHVRLNSADMTDAGLKAVAALPELRRFGMGRGPKKSLSEDGLKLLNNAAKLEELEFSGDYVTDTVLKDLSGMAELKRLEITFSKKVTDKGMQELIALPKLEYLHISGCATTPAGLDTLKKAKPKLQIDTSFGT